MFSVDELPDGTLLVTFLATQRLWVGGWGGGGKGMGEREVKTEEEWGEEL